MSEVPRHWRLKTQRYRLMGNVCPDCDRKNFPPRDVCPDCNGEISIQPDEAEVDIYISEDSPALLPRQLPGLPNY